MKVKNFAVLVFTLILAACVAETFEVQRRYVLENTQTVEECIKRSGSAEYCNVEYKVFKVDGSVEYSRGDIVELGSYKRSLEEIQIHDIDGNVKEVLTIKDQNDLRVFDKYGNAWIVVTK